MKVPDALGIRAAKARFEALVEAAAGGREITITSRGKPVAKLFPAQAEGAAREFGWAKNFRFWIAPDFDSYVPPEFEDFL